MFNTKSDTLGVEMAHITTQCCGFVTFTNVQNLVEIRGNYSVLSQITEEMKSNLVGTEGSW